MAVMTVQQMAEQKRAKLFENLVLDPAQPSPMTDEEQLAKFQKEYQEMLMKVKAFDQIVELMGYVRDGSDTPVTLSQDDATGSFVVSLGTKIPNKHRYWGNDLISAIHLAATGE